MAATGGTEGPRLLPGGNPQIPKGDGPGPVQDYLDAMPGWKADVGAEVDALVVELVPDVAKAIRWNSPWYGVEGQGWFLTFHCFAKYLKVTFMNGAGLEPEPPVAGKDDQARSLHLTEGAPVDTPELRSWITQSAALPGWDGS